MDATSVIAMDSRTRRLEFRSMIVLSIATVLAVGCGTQPYRPPATTGTPVPSSSPPPVPAPQGDPGAEIVAIASQLIGSPYRFGGSGPREFDCSGLVVFVHNQLGIYVPRTAAEQAAAAAPVNAFTLAPGDLVFFTESGPEITHVGIYAGQGKFVHAPKTGRPVGYGSLFDDYYLHNFAGAGRFYRSR
jgi:cell wall-associated NlpC family hydrolase